MKKKKQNNYVSPGRRKRESKMADVRNRYAFSVKSKIMHDKDCRFVRSISDEYFDMSHDFLPGFELCPKCRRRALIRRGIGDDRKHLDAFVRFFWDARISNIWLIELFVVRNIQVIWISIGEAEIVYNGEHWIIKIADGGVELYHNNYITSYSGTKIIRDGFHRQLEGVINPNQALRHILNYSWENHMKNKNEN